MKLIRVKQRIYLTISFLIVLLGSTFFIAVEAFHPKGFLMGFNREIDTSFEKITLGTPIEEVVLILGTPSMTSELFLLPQRKGFEEEFDRAKASKASQYYQWINGKNWYYCIGVDEEFKVIVKTSGCS